jgi:hypothetical protein
MSGTKTVSPVHDGGPKNLQYIQQFYVVSHARETLLMEFIRYCHVQSREDRVLNNNNIFHTFSTSNLTSALKCLVTPVTAHYDICVTAVTKQTFVAVVTEVSGNSHNGIVK